MENVLKNEDYLLWILLVQVRNILKKLRQKELKRYNLTNRQASMLIVLEATNGMISAYKISKLYFLEPHTISTLFVRMERKGLITKAASDNQKNVRYILTTKGRDKLEKIKFVAIPSILATLSSDDRKQFESILTKLRDEALAELGITSYNSYNPDKLQEIIS